MFAPTFPDLQGLVSRADHTGFDIRPTLLRVLTDLYVQKPRHSMDEERHYTELATRLIDVVDTGTRNTIAGKLADYPEAPLPVLERLGREGPAQTAIAWTVPPSVTDTALPSPVAAPPPAPVAAPVTAAAATSNPAHELSELFFAADARERKLILLNLDYAAIVPAAPPAEAQAAEAVRRLQLAALTRKPDAFMTAIEQFLAIPKICAARVAEDRSGESILVAGKALGMPAEIFQRIILFLNPAVGLSVPRVHDLAQAYNEVSRESALRLVAIWRAAETVAVAAAPAARSAAYRPVHYNDETARARDMATHAPRRIAARTPEQDRARRRDPA